MASFTFEETKFCSLCKEVIGVYATSLCYVSYRDVPVPRH